MLSNTKQYQQCYARQTLSNTNAIVELHSLSEQKSRQMGDNNNNNNKRETTKTGSQSCRGLRPAAKNRSTLMMLPRVSSLPLYFYQPYFQPPVTQNQLPQSATKLCTWGNNLFAAMFVCVSIGILLLCNAIVWAERDTIHWSQGV